MRKETRFLFHIFLHPTFIYLSLMGTGILLIAVTAVYFLERDLNPRLHTFFDGLWWGVSTITTVGYGDITPITFPGRLIGLVLMYTGTVLFIAFTGILVTFWTKKEIEKEIQPIEKEMAEEEKEQARIERKLDEVLKHLKRSEK